MRDVLETRIGRRGALKATALAVWAGAIALLSFVEAMAPAPSLPSNGHLASETHAPGIVEASLVKEDFPGGIEHPGERFAFGALVGSTIASSKSIPMDLRSAGAVPGFAAICLRRGNNFTNRPQHDLGGDGAAAESESDSVSVIRSALRMS